MVIAVSSPCNGVCHLRGILCVGCFRNTHEISTWGSMTMEKRMETMAKLDSRAKCPSCGKWNKCAIEEGKSANACWCMEEPVKKIKEDNIDSCLCRTCYQQSGEN